MQEIKYTAICVNSIDYKECDRLLTLYAFGAGRITANCRGVKKAKAKLRYASEVMTFGTYYLGMSNGYYTVLGCDMIDSFYDIRLDIDKYYPALIAMEVLDKFGGDREVSDRLGGLVLEFLRAICYSNIDVIAEFIRFLLDVLTVIGYEVSMSGCAVCGATDGSRVYFSSQYGGIVYDCCHDDGAVELSLSEYSYMRDIARGKKAEKIPDDGSRRIVNLLTNHLAEILGKKLRSAEEYSKFLI